MCAGVDLVGALLGIDREPGLSVQPPGRPGVRTHQVLLALTRASEQGRGDVARELWQAARGAGPYRDSLEELTSVSRGPRSAVLIGGVVAGLLIAPKRLSALFTGGSVTSYSLTPDAWRGLGEA